MDDICTVKAYKMLLWLYFHCWSTNSIGAYISMYVLLVHIDKLLTGKLS